MRSHFKGKDTTALPKEERASDTRPQRDGAVSRKCRKGCGPRDWWNHGLLLWRGPWESSARRRRPLPGGGRGQGWGGLRAQTAEPCGKAEMRITVLGRRWACVTNQLNQASEMQKVVTGGSMICILIMLKTGD